MYKYKVIAISLAILLSGCSDDSSQKDEGAKSGLKADTASPNETQQKQAIVIIGKYRYQFKLTRCNSMLRYGDGIAKDGSDIRLSFGLSPANWKSRPASEGWSENGDFEIRDKKNNLHWQANENLAKDLTAVSPGQSQVDNYSINGKRATGSATFVDTTAIMTTGRAEPVKGTFEVVCN
ncbi:MAG: hypothetical protein BMS9Abin25_0175 [Gammaproteobacteria bacterium]|nr:MAG: hypothetical protein BMS9Abin25_0175 [Gammaproteobacteria bacterium]